MNLPKYHDESYRIIKLSSSEKIICDVLEDDGFEVILHKPMMIANVSGVGKGTFALVNYNNYSEDESIIVPKSQIIYLSTPMRELRKAYDMQKAFDEMRESTQHENTVAWQEKPKAESVTIDIEDVSGELAEEMDNPDFVESIAELVASILNKFGNGEEMEWDEDDLDTDRPDLGTKWTDWSPYPNDYLKEDED
jgi:hypothetical protein